MVALQVRADLDVELDLPGRDPVHVTLRGSGRTLDLRVDAPQVFAGRGDVDAVRAVADGLADRGLAVRVLDGETHLVTLGAVRAPWWQRRLTGSRHIRVGSARGLWTSARQRSRAGSESVLPDRALAPPTTLFPMMPTLVRRPRRRPTTTHAERGRGDPRLVLASRQGSWPGDRQPFFRLPRESTTIGSGETCDIRLPDLAELHAEVLLDDRDEFVLVARHAEVKVNGERVREAMLRTASRLEVGPWTLTFYREEYADHGRPYGGRVGGEVGHQQPQPPRRSPTSPSTSEKP